MILIIPVSYIHCFLHSDFKKNEPVFTGPLSILTCIH